MGSPKRDYSPMIGDFLVLSDDVRSLNSVPMVNVRTARNFFNLCDIRFDLFTRTYTSCWTRLRCQ
ncbi:hypothetical protein TH47_17605 [Thalassospira sp. MCCC 1A02803]|nr:hypothetical protein AUQ41_00215 [Thalassospira sp. MCCC 1A02898]ONH86400.1 hypothetical protein TH47_17605 [Thalassospira sp. MCCC 1A02803]